MQPQKMPGFWIATHSPRKCFSIQIVPGLDTPVMYVKGVGPRVSEMLAAKSILSAEDLLYHLPFRYEDRQNPRSLDELQPGETASVIAEVRGSILLRTRKAPIFELTVQQASLEEAFMTLTNDSVEYRSTEIASPTNTAAVSS